MPYMTHQIIEALARRFKEAFAQFDDEAAEALRRAGPR